MGKPNFAQKYFEMYYEKSKRKIIIFPAISISMFK